MKKGQRRINGDGDDNGNGGFDVEKWKKQKKKISRTQW